MLIKTVSADHWPLIGWREIEKEKAVTSPWAPLPSTNWAAPRGTIGMSITSLLTSLSELIFSVCCWQQSPVFMHIIWALHHWIFNEYSLPLSALASFRYWISCDNSLSFVDNTKKNPHIMTLLSFTAWFKKGTVEVGRWVLGAVADKEEEEEEDKEKEGESWIRKKNWLENKRKLKRKKS